MKIMKSLRQNQNAVATSLGAAGTAAALMFFLDPDRGPWRRAFLRDKTGSWARSAERSLIKATRDLSHRVQGVFAETRSHLPIREPADDAVLAERIRSKLGRVVSYPSAIDVTVRNGDVTLRGDVLQSEMRSLISCVSSTRDVANVRNDLKGHANSSGIPGIGPAQDRRLAQMSRRFRPTPGTQLLLGATGGLLAMYGARKSGLRGKVLGSIGLGLLGAELAQSGLTSAARRAGRRESEGMF
jgi:hypothetical protein